MSTPRIQRLGGLALALLLASPALPAVAQEAILGSGQIELHLEEALALGTLASDETITLAIEPQSPAPTINLAALREEAFAAAQETASEPASETNRKKNRGFGRWLKKYWWVPALAAVGVGVAIGDDDDRGEEDD